MEARKSSHEKNLALAFTFPQLTINMPLAVAAPETNDNRKQSHVMSWVPEEFFSNRAANRWQLMPWEWLPFKYPETATSQSHDLSSSHLCIFRIGRRMRGCAVGLCKRIESVCKCGQQERVGLFHQGAESLTRSQVTGILHLPWFPACCLA